MKNSSIIKVLLAKVAETVLSHSNAFPYYKRASIATSVARRPKVQERALACQFGTLICILALSGCSFMSPNQNQNTVAVVGTGSVMVQPDLVQMYISLSNTSPTTAQAQAEVSKSLSQALAILKEANIEDKNIQTTSLRFYAEYDYGNSKRVLIGQRAEQTIQFSIGGIEKDTKKVSSIIDRLATINGIQLNQMEFDVKDKTQHYAKARELAYQKALDKATQYANLAGQKIVKAINIAENGLTPISPIQYRSSNIMMKESFDISSATGTTLPTGELEITTDISVIFQIE